MGWIADLRQPHGERLGRAESGHCTRAIDLAGSTLTGLSRLTAAVGRNSDPMPPNPPSLDTAAASSADMHVPIGARMIGTSFRAKRNAI
jgi:hypothetical protein